MKTAVIIVAISFACLLFNPVRAADLTVTPASIAFHLASGSVVTRNLTVAWNGNIVTAARIFTNITPNGTGITVQYNIPIWDNYFFLQPKQQNITMTVTTSPALQPGNYTITTHIESMTEAQIIVKNNTVTVVDPWLQQQYSQLQGQYNDINSYRDALQENLTILYTNYLRRQSELDNATLSYQREKQAHQIDNALLMIFLLIASVLALYFFYRSRRRTQTNEMMPNGVRPIEEHEQVTMVRRIHK